MDYQLEMLLFFKGDIMIFNIASFYEFMSSCLFPYQVTVTLLQSKLTLKSNSILAIKWTQKYFKNYFDVIDNYISNNTIESYFCDSFKFEDDRCGEVCDFYLGKKGYKYIINENEMLYYCPDCFVHYVNENHNFLLISSNEKDNFRIPGRILREWLLSLSFNNYLKFHGATVVINDKAYLILGDKNAGKTTLLCNLIKRGANFCANDRVLVYENKGKLFTYGIPVSIKINRNTVAKFKEFSSIENLEFTDLNENSLKLELSPREFIETMNCEISQFKQIEAILLPKYSKDDVTINRIKDCNIIYDVLFRNALFYDGTFPNYFFNIDNKNKELIANIKKIPIYSISGNLYDVDIDSLVF